MTKIVILDSVTIGDDINLDKISNFGEIVSYPLTSKAQTAERIKDAEIVITNKVFIGEDEIRDAKNLKLVCVAATGYNNVDLKALNSKGIAATNVKGYSSQTVAQLVFTFILDVYYSLSRYNKLIKAGGWQKSEAFTMLNFPINDLENKTLGIVGYGNIGKKVAQIATAFGMKVVLAELPNRSHNQLENRMPLDEMLKVSDIITLHCPLTDATKNLISAPQLNLMKPSAVLINTSRGPVVNLDDLYTALKNNKIRHACIDVMPQEPPQQHPIFQLENVTITPHIGWASKESRERLVEGIANNIRIYKNGDIDSIKLKS
ncbi:MAG: D-2-hydroxyacid dehydrogenase [Bacteroidales bacterium]|nr:D-2-hydroxyacid dehydrogenase [Bacteroidales bacterium]